MDRNNGTKRRLVTIETDRGPESGPEFLPTHMLVDLDDGADIEPVMAYGAHFVTEHEWYHGGRRYNENALRDMGMGFRAFGKKAAQ